jgi:hypothetical protein
MTLGRDFAEDMDLDVTDAEADELSRVLALDPAVAPMLATVIARADEIQAEKGSRS